MGGFLLLVVVHVREGKEEERLWRLVVWRWLVEEGWAFIGRSILWIALGLVFPGGGEVFFAGCMCVVGIFKVCGLQRGEE